MVATWISNVASIGMAVGPPLVYADQAASIIRKKCVLHNLQASGLLTFDTRTRDSTGFSRDVCAILFVYFIYLYLVVLEG